MKEAISVDYLLYIAEVFSNFSECKNQGLTDRREPAKLANMRTETGESDDLHACFTHTFAV